MIELSKLKLIGIVGLAGSGKDTIASHLCSRFSDTYVHHFADPLKEGVAKIFGIPLDDMYDEVKKNQPHPYWNRSPREILQFVGTEMFRTLIGQLTYTDNNDFWIKRLAGHLQGPLIDPEIHSEYAEGDCVIIADVRFQNEVNWIEQNGGTIIKVIRYTGDEQVTVGIPNHASEQVESLHFTSNPFLLINNSTLEELHARVNVIATNLGLQKKPAPEIHGISEDSI